MTPPAAPPRIRVDSRRFWRREKCVYRAGSSRGIECQNNRVLRVECTQCLAVGTRAGKNPRGKTGSRENVRVRWVPELDACTCQVIFAFSSAKSRRIVLPVSETVEKNVRALEKSLDREGYWGPSQKLRVVCKWGSGPKSRFCWVPGPRGAGKSPQSLG